MVTLLNTVLKAWTNHDSLTLRLFYQKDGAVELEECRHCMIKLQVQKWITFSKLSGTHSNLVVRSSSGTVILVHTFGCVKIVHQQVIQVGRRKEHRVLIPAAHWQQPSEICYLYSSSVAQKKYRQSIVSYRVIK